MGDEPFLLTNNRAHALNAEWLNYYLGESVGSVSNANWYTVNTLKLLGPELPANPEASETGLLLQTLTIQALRSQAVSELDELFCQSN